LINTKTGSLGLLGIGRIEHFADRGAHRKLAISLMPSKIVRVVSY
jgi:hypothetical protein